MRIIEAIGAKNDEIPDRWRVQVIEAGISANGNIWDLGVLHEAVDRFDGVRVIARDDELHLQNRGKKVQDLAGWLTHPKPNDKGIEAVFEIEADWLKKKTFEAFQRGKKDYYGLSLIADVEWGSKWKRVEGRVGRSIRKITKVDFVDAIVDPSAGGGVVGLAEARGGFQVEKFLKLIEAKDPKAYKRLTASDDIDEAEVLKVFEALLADPDPDPDQDPEGDKKKKAAAKKAAEAKATGADNVISIEQIQEAVAEATGGFKGEIAKMLDEQRQQLEFDHTAQAAVAESKLPADTQKRVLESLKGKSDISEIAKVIESEANYLRRHTAWVGPGSTDGTTVIEGVVDEMDRYNAALEGFFLDDDVVIEGTKSKQPRYNSIKEAYIDLTGDVHVTGQVKHAPRVREAAAAIVTTTWTEMLGDHIHKALQREYKLAPFTQWRLIADVVPVPDFRINYRGQLGGFGSLDSVAEEGTYTGIGTQPSESHVPYYQVTKYGNTQVITLETIVNDDVGAVRRIPRKLARAAARTLNTNVWAPVLNNSNVSWEAVALCAAAHGSNITTNPLSPSSIIAGRTTMMKQTEPDSSERLNIGPKYLAVPVDMEDTAYEYCVSPNKPNLDKSTDTAVENEAILNFIRSQNLMPLVIPHWTETNDALLLADKMDVPMLEVGFLGGRQEPELFVQDMPNVGSMFTNDEITYKIRHIYGVTPLDYRGYYRFSVT